MKTKVKTVKDNFYKLEEKFETINGMSVDVGVLGGGEMAWLASIHEFGCRIKVTEKMRAYLRSHGMPLKDTTTEIVIPERSFLRAGFDKYHEMIEERTALGLVKLLYKEITPEQYLKMLGVFLKSKIQLYAKQLTFPPNHPYTVEQKGSSNPLIDTGHMVNHISYKVNR